MANEAIFYGFETLKSLDGSNYPIMNFYVPATDGVAIFIGDAVVITGESNENYINGSNYSPGSLPVVKQAEIGDGKRVTGIVVGIEQGMTPIKITGDIYRLANTEAVLKVAIATPENLWRIRADGAVVTGDVGQTLNIASTPVGNTTTGRSGMKADMTSKGTGATKQMKIVNIDDRIDNEIGDYTDLIVKLNNVTYGNSVAGI